jgi:hypothetical protein
VPGIFSVQVIPEPFCFPASEQAHSPVCHCLLVPTLKSQASCVFSSTNPLNPISAFCIPLGPGCSVHAEDPLRGSQMSEHCPSSPE